MDKFRYVPSYTIEDYLQWEGDWELWDGVPVAMSPSPNRLHQRIASNLQANFWNQLNRNSTCQCEVLTELDWHLDKENIRRPDLVIACDHSDSDYLREPPTLIVEILSESTASQDRVYKRQAYARAGVRYYLIVDPDAQTVESLRLQGDTYVPAEPPFELHDGCSLTLDPDQLWP